MTGVASKTGHAYPSGAPDATPILMGVHIALIHLYVPLCLFVVAVSVFSFS